MLVKDKGRDIAILRTMGATRGALIMRIFFMTGASIGVVGTLAGVDPGVAFAENIEAPSAAGHPETDSGDRRTLPGGDLLPVGQLPA